MLKSVIISTDSSIPQCYAADETPTITDWARRTKADDRNLATKVDNISAASRIFSYVDKFTDCNESWLRKSGCTVIPVPGSDRFFKWKNAESGARGHWSHQLEDSPLQIKIPLRETPEEDCYLIFSPVSSPTPPGRRRFTGSTFWPRIGLDYDPFSTGVKWKATIRSPPKMAG